MTDALGFALRDFLKRDTLVVAAALGVITILAWTYLVVLNGEMQMPAMAGPAPTATADMQGTSAMSGMDMHGMKGMSGGMSSGQAAEMTTPSMTAWTPTHFLFIFTMWAVMMVGMMTPSVSPMVLTYARVARSAAAQGTPFASSVWFAGGYLVAWTAFALAASFGQYALDRAALLTPMMELQSRVIGGAALIAAGLYQWLPMKGACLSNCRAPLAFVERHGGFRASAAGSLRLGAVHGLYCIGCCWALMLLLFVAGVMNLFWIAALMAIVLAEKIVPAAPYLTRTIGAVTIAGGLWLLGT